MARDIHHLLAKMPQEDSLLTPQQSPAEDDDNAWILLGSFKKTSRQFNFLITFTAEKEKTKQTKKSRNNVKLEVFIFKFSSKRNEGSHVCYSPCYWKVHIYMQRSHTRHTWQLCEVTPYVNRASGGKTRCGEEILCINAKLCVPFALPCSYFLFSAPLMAPILLLHLSSAASRVSVRDCAGVRVPVCSSRSQSWKDDTDRLFVFVPPEFADTGEE